MSIDRPQLQATLQNFKLHEAVRVAFVLDGKGSLVAWAGKAKGFSPTGQFQPGTAGDPETDLFLTIMGPYFIGVLFDGESDIDAVRAEYDRQKGRFATALRVPVEA